MKTQQRFFYKTETGEKKTYLLMPNEYLEVINLLKLGNSLEYSANKVGLSTKYMDVKTLKMQQTILGE